MASLSERHYLTPLFEPASLAVIATPAPSEAEVGVARAIETHNGRHRAFRLERGGAATYAHAMRTRKAP